MDHLRSITSVFVTCSLLASSAALAGVVPLNNPSFESPTLSVGAPFVGTVQNWIGSYLGTAFASSYGISATNGTQVAYLQNTPGQNYVLVTGDGDAAHHGDGVQSAADIRPLANDPANNCAFIQLTRTSFGVIFAQATYKLEPAQALRFFPRRRLRAGVRPVDHSGVRIRQPRLPRRCDGQAACSSPWRRATIRRWTMSASTSAPTPTTSASARATT